MLFQLPSVHLVLMVEGFRLFFLYLVAGRLARLEWLSALEGADVHCLPQDSTD